MAELLDSIGIASMLLKSQCVGSTPLVEAIFSRGWAWLSHGQNNSTLQANLDKNAEREYCGR
jgi:hypothetical protein